MKKSQRFLLVLGIALSCSVLNASAQIVVHVRPTHAVVVRTAAPGPHYVWVGEEWVGRNGRYEWSGGHWVLPPHPGWVWIPGHWARRPRGYVWIGGHWRHRR